MSAFYCPNCLCDDCQVITARANSKKARLKALEDKKIAREAEARQRAMEVAETFNRESGMIWMLINLAANQNEANWIIQKVAEALALSPGQVNSRRAAYATRLMKRTHHFNGERFYDSWAAIPGAEGTELPDSCEKCGGMKTEGRKCKRCDYRRGSRYVPSST